MWKNLRGGTSQIKTIAQYVSDGASARLIMLYKVFLAFKSMDKFSIT